jgi:hypothetical protein
MRREMCVCLYVCIGATGPTSRLKSGQAVLGSKDWSFGSSLDLIQLRVRRVAELNVKFILGYNFHAGGRETRGRQRFMEGGGLGKRASVGLPRLFSCDICILLLYSVSHINISGSSCLLSLHQLLTSQASLFHIRSLLPIPIPSSGPHGKPCITRSVLAHPATTNLEKWDNKRYQPYAS